MRNTSESGFQRFLNSGGNLPEPFESEQFIVNVKYPSDTDLKPIDELSLDVMYGIQEFDFAYSSTKPLIIVSASYDGTGAAPSMQAGIERSVSSLLAVFHISRLLGGKSTT